MFKDWPGCFDVLFHIRTVSYGCHLLGLGVRFLLCSTSALAALPHLLQVVDLGHDVKFFFLCLSLHFQVILWVHHIQCWVIACQNPVIGSSNLPYTNLFANGISCGFWLPQADRISPKGKTGLHSHNMWYDREYVSCRIREIALHWVSVLLLLPPVGCCTVGCARVVACARAYAKVCLLYRAMSHVALT